MHNAVRQIWIIDACGGLPREVDRDILYLQEKVFDYPANGSYHRWSQDDCEEHNLHNLQVFMQEHNLDSCYIYINW